MIYCKRKIRMDLMFLAGFLIMVYASSADEAFIGVNIGTSLSAMPDPTQVVALLKSQQINHVRLFDADRSMLLALANTSISVIVSVPNDQLLAVGQSKTTALDWVSGNILPYFPSTNITAIAVGSEVLTSLPNAAPVLVPAMNYIQSALADSNLDSRIKVSTPHSSSLLLHSFPPSEAYFNQTWAPIMGTLLKFLDSTGSFFMLNVYPYYDYVHADVVIPLDYALFRPLIPTLEAVDRNTRLRYTNVFDAVIDAAYFAMAALKFTNIPLTVTESGWPSSGDTWEPDATLDNANTYNSNLIKHVLNNTGTPKHPDVALSTYIYELYNEDLRTGPISVKNWGLFDGVGVAVYMLRSTGSGSVLANETNRTYCVAKKDIDKVRLEGVLEWACGPGKVDCSVLNPGKPCYEPNDVVAHASYAFNSYYQRMNKGKGTCVFSGVATITTKDPSHGSCIFPGSAGTNGTFPNSTSLAPSPDSMVSGSHSVFSCAQDFCIRHVVLGVVLWMAVYL